MSVVAQERSTLAVLLEIADERARQVDVHEWTPDHDDQHGRQEWAWLLLRRVTDLAHPWDDAHLDTRRELLEVAAIAVAAIESIDRKVAAVDTEALAEFGDPAVTDPIPVTDPLAMEVLEQFRRAEQPIVGRPHWLTDGPTGPDADVPLEVAAEVNPDDGGVGEFVLEPEHDVAAWAEGDLERIEADLDSWLGSFRSHRPDARGVAVIVLPERIAEEIARMGKSQAFERALTDAAHGWGFSGVRLEIEGSRPLRTASLTGSTRAAAATCACCGRSSRSTSRAAASPSSRSRP